jgi:hypothetical protein
MSTHRSNGRSTLCSFILAAPASAPCHPKPAAFWRQGTCFSFVAGCIRQTEKWRADGWLLGLWRDRSCGKTLLRV